MSAPQRPASPGWPKDLTGLRFGHLVVEYMEWCKGMAKLKAIQRYFAATRPVLTEEMAS